ncbi:MAG TPA: cytochrome c [Longimicrobium sp.]|nr:cytochrome c [Longimicrobium sp.]
MNKWRRRLLMGAGSLVALLLLVLAVVYGVSESRLRREYQISGRALAVTTDPAQVARGKHLATAVAKCADCHGSNLGGKEFINAGMLGVVYASNLTAGKGGVLPRYTDAQLERAIRHGVRADGRGLLIMPSQEFNALSDDDAAAIIAYLRSLRPVDNVLPKAKVGPLGRALFVAGKLPLLPAEDIDHAAAAPRTAPPLGATREYGAYMAQVGGCTGCHTPTLAGEVKSAIPDHPPAANITPKGIGSWTEADFFKAMRTGVRPNGTRINEAMPWKSVGLLSDTELRALWMYLQSVPAAEPKGAKAKA